MQKKRQQEGSCNWWKANVVWRIHILWVNLIPWWLEGSPYELFVFWREMYPVACWNTGDGFDPTNISRFVYGVLFLASDFLIFFSCQKIQPAATAKFGPGARLLALRHHLLAETQWPSELLARAATDVQRGETQKPESFSVTWMRRDPAMGEPLLWMTGTEVSGTCYAGCADVLGLVPPTMADM